MSNNLSPRPSQDLQSKSSQQLIGILGGFALLFAAIFTFTQIMEESNMVHCDTCTQMITGSNSSSITLVNGDVLCITATGNFTGTLNRNNGTDTIRIVNEGTLDASSINFNRGINIVENYGTSSPGSVNYNNNANRNIWYNYAGASLNPTTFNLQQADGSLYNYGFFNPGTLNHSGGAEFINYAQGTVSLSTWIVNASTVTNSGKITISPGALQLNGSSTWDNQGKLDVGGDLTLNNQSDFTNNDSLNIGGALTLNSNSELHNTAPISVYYINVHNGDVNNDNFIDIDSSLTINGSGVLNLNGSISIGHDFTLNGEVNGPSGSSPYGMIGVAGVSTSNGGADVTGNIDICDAGSPSDGLDTKNGSYDPTVTHCVHTISTGGSFPVEFTQFDAKLEEGVVVLNWATASETNNQFFTIERRNEHAFEAIGEQDGAGNSNTTRQYRFTDTPNFSGRIAYRIKQTDFDGGYSYSNTVEVQVLPRGNVSASLAPNPTSGNTRMTVSLPVSQTIRVEIMSMDGAILKEDSHALDAGNQNLLLQIEDLPAGVYLVRLVNEGGAELLADPLKLIKQ